MSYTPQAHRPNTYKKYNGPYRPKPQHHTQAPRYVMSGHGSPMPTATYTCPYCGKDYQRVSIDGHIHPEADRLPCFQCAKDDRHRSSPSEANRGGAALREK